MTISPGNNGQRTLLVSCDGCTAGFDPDTASFARVKEHLRSRGWKTAPGNGGTGWRNFCPACARDRQHMITAAWAAHRASEAPPADMPAPRSAIDMKSRAGGPDA